MQLPRLAASGVFFLAAFPILRAEDTSPPIRWVRYEQPAYPIELWETLTLDGEATIVFTFDGEGRINDKIVLSASHYALVTALNEAAAKWQVDTRELPPSSHRETIRFDFKRRHPVLSFSHREAVKSAISSGLDGSAGALLTYREADLRPSLEPVVRVAPKYPKSLAPEHLRGVATVNFVVDIEGRVRVPGVTEASQPEFGEAALAAVKQWRFAPRLEHGQPVQVMVDRTFHFGSKIEQVEATATHRLTMSELPL